MSPRENRLRELFAQNNRRRNVSELRRKARALGVLAELGDEDDVMQMQSVDVLEPWQKLYPTNWDEIHSRLVTLLTAETEPVRMAPYDFQEFGFIRANPSALAEVLESEPFHFDPDGFWILGSFGAICVDFDNAEPGTDVLWLHYSNQPRPNGAAE